MTVPVLPKKLSMSEQKLNNLRTDNSGRNSNNIIVKNFNYGGGGSRGRDLNSITRSNNQFALSLMGINNPSPQKKPEPAKPYWGINIDVSVVLAIAMVGVSALVLFLLLSKSDVKSEV